MIQNNLALNETYFSFCCTIPAELVELWNWFCFEKGGLGTETLQESSLESRLKIFCPQKPDGGAQKLFECFKREMNAKLEIRIHEEGIHPFENWQANWREHFHPVKVGQSLIILPSWKTGIELSGRHPVWIDPGQLIFTFGSEYLMACHEEASSGMYPTLRGHSPKNRQSGFLTSFEGTTAFSSISTKCDEYTSFIELSYDQIAENAAQGHGPYLDALLSFRDYSINNKDRFQQLIRKHFSYLFENPENNGAALGHRLEIVLKHDRIFRNQCSTLNELS